MGILMTTSHMSAIRGSGHLSGTHPLAIHSVSSRLVISSSKHRKLSGCSHNHRHDPDLYKRHIYEHHRLYGPRMRTRPARQPRPVDPIVESHQPWWCYTWSSSLPSHKIEKTSGHPALHKDFWQMEVDRTRRTMDHIKQAIEKDPYGAIFGRRLEPFKSFEKFDKTFTSLCRALFGLGDKSADTAHADTAHGTPRTMTTTAKSENASDTTKKAQSTDSGKLRGPVVIHTKKNVTRYEFDPISGRMIPKEAKNPEVAEKGEGGINPVLSAADTTSASETTGYMSPMKRDAVESGSRDASNQGSLNDDLATDVVSTTVVKDQSQQSRSCVDSDTTQPDSTNQIKPSLDQVVDDSGKLQDARREKEEEEELESLSASDIRASYLRKEPDLDARASQDSNELNEMLETSSNTTCQVDASIDPRIECFQEATDQGLSSTTDDVAVPDKLRDVASDTANTSDRLALNEVQGTTPSPNPPSTVPHSLFGQVNTETYRVLAFDPIALCVTEAETSSSFHAPDEISHPAEILNRLNNPAKFLPYFEKLNNNGYEIVSGGGDVLVFRKTRGSLGHIEGTNACSKKGTGLSSSSFDNQQQRALDPNMVLQGSQSTPAETGEKASQGSKSAKILRRMLLGCVATAGTCYALCVVTEYFRTGGEDGRGIDAFTAFESERRHRE